jgi:hypothetical protein
LTSHSSTPITIRTTTNDSKSIFDLSGQKRAIGFNTLTRNRLLVLSWGSSSHLKISSFFKPAISTIGKQCEENIC